MVHKKYSKKVRQNLSNSFNGSVPLFDLNSKKAFAFSIDNKSPNKIRVAIFSGILNTKEEIINYGQEHCDYLLTPETIKDGASVIAVTKADKIDFFRRFFNNNPTAVSHMQITCKDQAQLAQSIVYKRFSPTRTYGSEEIVPIQHQSSKDSNTNLINLDVSQLILGDQSLLMVDVAPGNFVSISLQFGQTYDNFESAFTSDAE